MRKFLTAFLLSIVISNASAILCYVCNSHNDTDCMSIAPGERSKFLKDCDTIQDGTTYTLCRKVYMYLEQDVGEMHPAENRIHRACGYIEDEEGQDCYYKSGYSTRQWVCQCKEDSCNSSITVSPFLGLILASVLSAIVALMSNWNRV